MGLLIRIIIVLLLCGQAFAADYYVSPSGSGSTCSKASPCAVGGVPWTTADDEESTVYLMGGTYTTRLDITHNTTSNILYIKPCSASPDPTSCDSKVIFSANVSPYPNISITGSNVVIDGRTTGSSTTPCDSGDVSSCNIKIDVTGYSWTSGNVSGVSISTASSTGNVVKWLEITGRNTPSCAAGACVGYMVSAQNVGTGTEISNNYIHDNPSAHSDIIAYANTPAYGVIKIHHNIIRTSSQNYIFSQATPGGLDVYKNIFDVTSAAVPYDIIHLYASNSATPHITYMRIYNNLFDTIEQMIFLENNNTGGLGVEDIRIYNNVFTTPSTNTTGKPILFKSSYGAIASDDIIIANNVFYKTVSGITLSNGGQTITYTNLKIENNIFYEIGNSLPVGGTDATWANESDAILDYNIFYKASGMSFRWLYSGVMKLYSSTLTTFNSDHPTYTHNSISSPAFTNGDSDDWTLTESSPAINTGVDLSAVFTTDKAGTTRVVPWEVGAYEYSGGGSPPNYTITVSKSGDGCTLSADGGYSIPSGESLNVYLTQQNTGWQAYGAGWGGTCPATGSDPRVATPTEDCTVTYTCIPIRVMPWVR